METYILGNDIRVFCVTTNYFFPDGIRMEAFEKLHASVSVGRKSWFGYFTPKPKGTNHLQGCFWRSTKEMPKNLVVNLLLFKRGLYLSGQLFMKDLQGIGKAFQTLISQPNIDQMVTVWNGI